MSAITDAREAMAELVAAATGAQGYAYVPERHVPPSVVVTTGSPYLTPSGTFGTFALGLDVIVVAPAAVNEVSTVALDVLVDDAVVALVNEGYSVAEVSEPWQLTVGNATYLAATISTTQPVSL